MISPPSLDIAETFGKEHKNVLKDIRELECSEEFGRLNFEQTSYKDSFNRKQPMYYTPPLKQGIPLNAILRFAIICYHMISNSGTWQQDKALLPIIASTPQDTPQVSIFHCNGIGGIFIRLYSKSPIWGR